MTSSNLKSITQEGLLTEESLHVSKETCCPMYSGGDKNCEIDFNHDLSKTMDTDLAKRFGLREGKREPRVVLSRYDEEGGESDSSTLSMVTVSDSPDRSRKRRIGKVESAGSYSGSDDTLGGPATKVSTTRRGRGRPPTTGEYVGRMDALRELNQLKAEELRLEAERQLTAAVSRKAEQTSYLLRKEPQETGSLDAAQMERAVKNSVDIINMVATKSGNLKGLYVQHLKNAARILGDSFMELRSRTMQEEVALLVEANHKLTAELKEIRCEMEQLRSMRTVPSQNVAATTSSTPAVEEITRAIMVQVGTMMNARFAGLEERLLPERRLRPPLAADHRREEPIASTSAAQTCPVLPAKKASKGKKGKASPKAAAAETPPAARPVPPVQEQWTEVVGQGARRKAKMNGSVRSAAPVRSEAQKPNKPKKKKAKLRPPRTAAVVLTLQPGAAEKGITYAKVMEVAKSRIDLTALGFPPLRIRTAATGARILEVPGEEKDAMANTLAEKILEVFRGSEELKVSRPTLTADLRCPPNHKQRICLAATIEINARNYFFQFFVVKKGLL